MVYCLEVVHEPQVVALALRRFSARVSKYTLKKRKASLLIDQRSRGRFPIPALGIFDAIPVDFEVGELFQVIAV